jgi:hypothetical protein
MKRILFKAAVLIALVLPLQALMGGWLARRPFPRRDAIDQCLADRVDLLQFGDSLARHVSEKDLDRRPLAEMVADLLPDLRVGTLQGDGSSMELYEACVRYIARQANRPKRVLIPINLRSFSHEWDTRPEYQFRADRLRLRWGDTLALGFQTPLSTWRIYPLNPLTHEQHLRLPVEVDGRPLAVVRDLLEDQRSIPGWEPLPSQFAFRYLYTLEPGHRKLKSLASIVDVCRGAGMEPLFYIAPVDVEGGQAALGPMFRDRLGRNVDILLRRLDGLQAKYLDLSRELDSAAFDWKPGFPNEHLNERGRLRAGEALANFLRR